MPRQKITFLTLVLSHYRIKVHEMVREILAERGVEYEVLYSDPEGSAASKGDTANLGWARKVRLTTLRFLGREVHFQRAIADIRDSALVIVSQENKLLINYWLALRYLLSGRPFAYFGHGRGYQAKRKNGPLEWLKRFLATRCHWWFAYTEGVGSYLESIGFDRNRITVFRNSIDTEGLRSEIDKVSHEDVDAFAQRFGLGSGKIGLYIGGMYEEKRLDFLCEAAIRIRKEMPDFELVLIGGGSHAHIVEGYAKDHPFIRPLGPLFGKQRAVALKAADLFLMPGLVGLAVLDSFVGECPIVTTDYAHHSPEIEYLHSGENGLIVPDDGDPQTYAEAVTELLSDHRKIDHLVHGCRKSGRQYSAEAMAVNLARGMLKAVGSEDRRVSEERVADSAKAPSA